MLRNLAIQNFRVFGELTIKRLGRINLITGRNNSGKTSLLETLFLLSGGGNPKMILDLTGLRGIDSISGTSQTVGETIWKPLFSDLNIGAPVSISGIHSVVGPLKLEVTPDQQTTTQLTLEKLDASTDLASNSARILLLRFTGAGIDNEGRLSIAGPAIQIDFPNTPVPFDSIILSANSGNLKDDAVRLGQLRKRKQGSLVLEALKIIEPRLRSVEDNFALGAPMIWGDIGLSELVPLPFMGEGMTRVARIVLAIASVTDGVVLVDEIENGIHHSVLPEVWKVINRAAENFNVQVFATTHSYECMRDAYRALGADRLVLHRLETDASGNRCFTYKPSAIEAAINHELEVR